MVFGSLQPIRWNYWWAQSYDREGAQLCNSRRTCSVYSSRRATSTCFQEQILAEARRIAAQGGSFVFPPLQQKLSQPRPSLEAAKPALAQAVSKRPVDQQPISAEADAKRPRLAPVQEKLFAAVPLQERPNVVWIKDSQVQDLLAPHACSCIHAVPFTLPFSMTWDDAQQPRFQRLCPCLPSSW